MTQHLHVGLLATVVRKPPEVDLEIRLTTLGWLEHARASHIPLAAALGQVMGHHQPG